MGAEHSLTKGLHNVGTEMSLHVLAYNLKRAINILGVQGLLRALYALFVAVFFAPRGYLWRYAYQQSIDLPITRNSSSNS